MVSKLSLNMPLKLLSVLIAIVLWFAVLGSRNVEINKEVSIEIITPEDLIVSNEVPDKVNFRMSGPKAFLRSILNRKEDPIRINFSNAKAGVSTYRLFQDNIQVPMGVKVLTVNPSSIAVKLEPVKHKEVQVRLVTKGTTPPGFNLVNLNLTQDTIKLKGPESKISALKEISTVPIDLAELTESGEKEVGLDFTGEGGVMLDERAPTIKYEVSQVTANFKIRNADVKANVGSGKKAKVDPKEVTIFVKCTADELKEVNRSKVFGIVNVTDKPFGTYEVPISVTLPPNIKLIKVVPQKAKVTVY